MLTWAGKRWPQVKVYPNLKHMKSTKFDGKKEVVTVAEYSSKLTKTGGKYISFTDSKGTKYNFFSTVGVWNEAGEMTGQKESAAYREWQTLGDPVGKVIEIGFVEKQEEYEGKPFTDRRVKFLSEMDNTVVVDENYTEKGKIPTIQVDNSDIPF